MSVAQDGSEPNFHEDVTLLLNLGFEDAPTWPKQRVHEEARRQRERSNGDAGSTDPFDGFGPDPQPTEPGPQPEAVAKPNKGGAQPIDFEAAKAAIKEQIKKRRAAGDTSGLQPPKADLDEIIEEMNKEHCVISNIGGKVRIMSWDRSGPFEVPIFQTFPDFKNRYANQLVPGGKVPRTRAEYWIKHPLHHQYDGLVLRPGRHGTGFDDEPSPNYRYLNLWRSFGVLPVKGDWSLMQDHIFGVLAAGDALVEDYILRWAAWAVQNPDKPAEAALVMLGDEGTGRGVFFRSLGRCFGQHFRHISDVNALVGKHNRHLMDTIFLFSDEAYWPGNKAGEGVLKRLITEPTIWVEPKGVDSFQVDNLLHIAMASNNDWAVPAGPDARRYVVQRVSDRWSRRNSDEAERREYFRELYSQMDERGGCEAMLYDLLHFDLEDWHPRNIIETEGLADQKQQSLPPEDSWLQDILMSGILPGDYRAEGWTPCEVLFDHYVEHGKKRGGAASRRADQTRLGIRLMRFGAVKEDCKVIFERPMKNGGTETRTIRGAYKFPSLAEARAKFEHVTGTRPQWTERNGEWAEDDLEYKQPERPERSDAGFTRGYR